MSISPGTRVRAPGLDAGAVAAAIGALLPILLGGLLLAGAVASRGAAPDEGVSAGRSAGLLLKTAAIAVIIAAVATGLAIPAAWAIRRVGPRVGALVLAPLLLPSYLVYASWGLLRAPGTALGDALEGGSPAFWAAIGHAQAMLGLALWSWPMAAAALAVSAARIEPAALEALRGSGAGVAARAATVARLMRGGIGVALGTVALVMMGSAVPLHLANVETSATALWRRMAEGAAGTPLWVDAAPIVVVNAGLALWLTGGLSARRDRVEQPGAERDEGVSRRWVVAALAVWGASAVAPMVLFAANLRGAAQIENFWALSREPLAASAATAALVGAAGGGIAAATAAGASSAAPMARAAAALSVRAWVVLAAIPGVLIGAAALSASGLPGMDWLAESRGGLVAAHVARFGAVAALLGWFAGRAEPAVLADARRMFGGGGLLAWARTTGRLHAGLIGAAAAAMAALSAHEIEAAVFVAPPGSAAGATFAQRMLGLLHYLRDDELCAAGLAVCAAGLAASLLASGAMGAGAGRWRRLGAGAAGVVAMALMVGCEGANSGASGADRGGAPAPARVFGGAGKGDGQFVYPRCLDAGGGSLWVIDKTARVQRLSPKGEAVSSWRMPKFDRGMPTGVTYGPDGLVYVADTHEHRVVVYRPTERGAELVRAVGEYGTGPGRFIYVTHVAVWPGADGRTPEWYYVSEYGGNDRVSVFDAEWNFVGSFGRPGAAGESGGAEDVVFARPQSIAVDAARGELIVTDAANHRIGRFTRDGALLAWIGAGGGSGKIGTALGEFAYPYGVCLLPDGTALIAEFGNNRVQRVDVARGVGLGFLGAAGGGRGEGALATPWAVAALGGEVFVLDSGNNRVQAYRLADVEAAR